MNPNLKNLNDEELILLYKKKKDADAFSVLYDRYAHLVYGVCLKYLKDVEKAKDATMQIFEKFFMEIGKHEIRIFRAWIYRVAQNHCFMEMRSNNHFVKSVDFIRDEIMESEDYLHPITEKEKMYENLEKAIEKLNEEQKQCILLFYIQKKTYQEIMELTGYSFMQVKSNIQNGKRNLKIIMSNMN